MPKKFIVEFEDASDLTADDIAETINDAHDIEATVTAVDEQPEEGASKEDEKAAA